MPTIKRVRVEWTGAPVVGPGVSTFHFSGVHVGFVSDIAAFFNSISTWVPTGTTLQIPGSGDTIDEATGQINGSWSDGAPATLNMGGAGNYQLGVGARVVWGTSGIRNGRRVKGSTFIVPIISAAYATDGTPATAALAAWQTAANTFLINSDNEFIVYSRPAPGSAGQSNLVVGATFPDKVSWLRSRRT